ncbi:MAG: viperin family antiviral radical SAM protein [Bacteroidia bacterium]|nr:viperin family antiviral radical SAM protein [Bacteroidia bacterium]MDW8302011.1 viperin family antiviral radical SAM protein [Bacteroidia bacterium]
MIATVNYHLIKACNYQCQYCYATFNDIREKPLSLSEQIKLISLLAKSKYFKKINFAGGEPLLVAHLPKLIKVAKEEGFKETSVVTNGSRLTKEWIYSVKDYLDILAISIDSVSEGTNIKIGRKERGSEGKTLDLDKIIKISELCHAFNIHLKVNTVVNAFNKRETLTDVINKIKPFRWKVLQATKIEGQNDENYSKIAVTNQEFEEFCQRNKKYLRADIDLITEPSEIIQGSYLMIDFVGRFYDSSCGKHRYSDKILKVGVENAIEQVNVDADKFCLRGGDYRVKD